MFDKNFDFTGQLQNKSNENKAKPLWELPRGTYKAQLKNIRYVLDKKNGKGAPVNAFFADLVVQSIGDHYAMFKFDHEKDMQRISGIINQIFPADLHTKKEFEQAVEDLKKPLKRVAYAPSYFPVPFKKLLDTQSLKTETLPDKEIEEVARNWAKAYFLIYKKVDAFIAGRLDGSVDPATFEIVLSEFKGKEGNMIQTTQYIKINEAFDAMLPESAEVETPTDDIPF